MNVISELRAVLGLLGMGHRDVKHIVRKCLFW